LSYVTRGDMIGVFAPKDDKLRFRTTIDKIQTTDGKSFIPKKVSSPKIDSLSGHAPQSRQRYAHARSQQSQRYIPYGS
jgi:hypothetical protein